MELQKNLFFNEKCKEVENNNNQFFISYYCGDKRTVIEDKDHDLKISTDEIVTKPRLVHDDFLRYHKTNQKIIDSMKITFFEKTKQILIIGEHKGYRKYPTDFLIKNLELSLEQYRIIYFGRMDFDKKKYSTLQDNNIITQDDKNCDSTLLKKEFMLNYLNDSDQNKNINYVLNNLDEENIFWINGDIYDDKTYDKYFNQIKEKNFYTISDGIINSIKSGSGRKAVFYFNITQQTTDIYQEYHDGNQQNETLLTQWRDLHDKKNDKVKSLTDILKKNYSFYLFKSELIHEDLYDNVYPFKFDYIIFDRNDESFHRLLWDFKQPRFKKVVNTILNNCRNILFPNAKIYIEDKSGVIDKNFIFNINVEYIKILIKKEQHPSVEVEDINEEYIKQQKLMFSILERDQPYPYKLTGWEERDINDINKTIILSIS